MKIDVGTTLNAIYNLMDEITDKACIEIKNAESVEKAHEIRIRASAQLDICTKIANGILAIT